MLVNKNLWFTVMLCIGLNGRKLKLYIVLKRKTVCKVMQTDISLLTKTTQPFKMALLTTDGAIIYLNTPLCATAHTICYI